MKKSGYCINVKTKNGSTFSFDLAPIDPKYLKEWADAGIEIIYVSNTIPVWLPTWAVKPWCFCQSVFNFRNPFR